MLPCPSRSGVGPAIGNPAEDHFRADDTCSYCGSLNPDVFMAKLEASEISLGPTDKSYKVYVEGIPNPKAGRRKVGGSGTSAFHGSVAVADLGPEDRALVDAEFQGPKRRASDYFPTHVQFVTEPDFRFAKFYFDHLSVDQRKRFVELLNENRLRIEAPGYFYVRPFFVQRVPASSEEPQS